jgi:mannose-6-phosphate isomerase-like protein (cupin superfamily)
MHALTSRRPGHRPRLIVAVISMVVGLALAGCTTAQRTQAPQRAPREAQPSSVHGYVTNIERATLENEDYRRVLFTTPHLQLVLMTLREGEEIGSETHPEGDQFVRVEAGTGMVVLNGEQHPMEDGSVVVIPAGVEHNVVNTGRSPLRLYVLYSPPEHPPGTVHRTKQEAEAKEPHHH